MGKTRSRRRDNLIAIASGDKALTLYHRCSYTRTLLHLVGFTFLCFLPLRKLPLALFAVIVFPYQFECLIGTFRKVRPLNRRQLIQKLLKPLAFD